MYRIIDEMEGKTLEEMLAAKYNITAAPTDVCILDLAVDRYNEMIDEEERLFTEAADEKLNSKRSRAKRRKAGYTKSARKNKACSYERSGLIKTESGAIHSRKGSTYNKKKYQRLRKNELQAMVEEAMEPIYAYRDYSDDYYDDYMEYLDYMDRLREEEMDEYYRSRDYYDDYYDDYLEDEHQDEITNMQVRLEQSYNEGYEAGYAAAMRAIQATCSTYLAKH
jgi:hypothetical protein